jgi:hypothetical protein
VLSCVDCGVSGLQVLSTSLLSTDHELIPAGVHVSAGRGDYRERRWTEDFLLVSDKGTVTHSLTANIGQFGSIITELFLS